MDWQSLLGGHGRVVTRNGIGWEGILLAAIVFFHFTLLAFTFSWRTNSQDTVLFPDTALQVSFIDRIVPPYAGQTKPSSNTKNKTGLGSDLLRAIREDGPGSIESHDENLHGASLRLTLDHDEWQVDTTTVKKDPMKRQYIAVPGRAEPFVEGIKLTGTMTPRQKLSMVGKLFGAVDYDPCKEARNRMANVHSRGNDLDVQADLRAIEQHCR